jgi:Phage capsid protein
MADTAFKIQYRQEFIDGFEQGQSLLRDAVTTESVINGNQATFLVADSGGATATTRGVNGLIPSRADNLTQSTATLAEWHDLVRKTGFNIFGSQGNQRAIMQKTTMGVINRKVDSDILTELGTATVTAGAAATASLAMVLKAKTILQIAEVPWDNNIMAVISPAFEAYLLAIAAYTSADYVDLKPMTGGNGWNDKVKAKRWLDINWIVHPNVAGVGTSSETCLMFHRSAIGHAANTAGMTNAVGYDEEQDYSYARCSVYMGSKLLQNSGVVKMLHDGSAYVGS